MNHQLPVELDPSSEDPTPSEVVLLFGIAAYRSQALELALGYFIVALQLAAPDQEPIDVGTLNSKTLGQLVVLARTIGPVPAALDADLKDAVLRRNHLVHRFFIDRAGLLQSDTGCRRLAEELRSIASFFTTTHDELKAVNDSIAIRFGMDQAEINRRVDALVEKWASL